MNPTNPTNPTDQTDQTDQTGPMIKHQKLPKDITASLNDAIRYLDSRNEVVFAYLFGSLAKGAPSPLSDVDIAAYFREDVHLPEAKTEILCDLIDILNTDEIDFVVLNRAPLSLTMRMLEGRRVIVDHEPFLRHRFESLIMRQAFDFSRREMQMLERRFLSGR